MRNWTVDPETNRSNSSPEFQALVEAVERLIRGEAHSLIAGRADQAAQLLMAQLAHVHGLVPGAQLAKQSAALKLAEEALESLVEQDSFASPSQSLLPSLRDWWPSQASDYKADVHQICVRHVRQAIEVSRKALAAVREALK